MPKAGLFNLKNLSTPVLNLRNNKSEKEKSNARRNNTMVTDYTEGLSSPTSTSPKSEKRKSGFRMTMLANQSLPNLLSPRKPADIVGDRQDAEIEGEHRLSPAESSRHGKQSVIEPNGASISSCRRMNRLESPQSHYKLRDRPISLYQLQDLRHDAEQMFATARRPLTPDPSPVYRRSMTCPSTPLAPSSPLLPNSPRRGRRKPVPDYLQLGGRLGFSPSDDSPTPMDWTPLGSPFGAPSASPFYSNSRAVQSMFALTMNDNDSRISTSPVRDSHARCPSASGSAVSTLSSWSSSTTRTLDSSLQIIGTPQRVVPSPSASSLSGRESRATADATMGITTPSNNRHSTQEVQPSAGLGSSSESWAIRPKMYSIITTHCTPALHIEEVE